METKYENGWREEEDEESRHDKVCVYKSEC